MTDFQAPQPAPALLVQALEDIIEPFAYIERTLPEGYRIDGQAALQQINSREFYARIAKEALAAHRAAAIPAPEGEPGLRAAAQKALDMLSEVGHWDHRGDTLEEAWDEKGLAGRWRDNLKTLRAALAAQPQVELLRMLAHRARCFPNYPLGYHIPEVFAALGEQPPEPAPAEGEREAFDAVVAKECGPGATKRWLGTDAYENHRVNDNRMGWVWCLDWLARSAANPQPKGTAADQKTWCGYVASMVGGYLGFGVDDERNAVMAGIIERRLWALSASAIDDELAGKLARMHSALGKMQRKYGDVGSRDVDVAEWNSNLFDAMRAIGSVLCELPSDKLAAALSIPAPAPGPVTVEALFQRLEDAALECMTEACNAGKVAHKPGIYMPAVKAAAELAHAIVAIKQQLRASGACACTCPSGDGSLRWPCAAHPPTGSAIPAPEGAELISQLREPSISAETAKVLCLEAADALAAQPQPELLRMLAHRARCFPNYPLGYHIPEVFAALGEQPPEPAPAEGEREAFDAVVAKECGPGATKRWLGTDAYENHRVNDNRMGWVWCLDWLARSAANPQPKGTAEPHGWVVWWPKPGGGHSPQYTHGPKRQSYGAELDALLRHYPVYDAPQVTQAPAPAPEPVAWRYEDARGHYRYVGHKPHRANFAAEYAILNPVPLYAAPAPSPAVGATDESAALDLLATLFDAYENGTACYSDPEGLSGFLGNAVHLSGADFHACAELLNRRRPRTGPHPSVQGSQS